MNDRLVKSVSKSFYEPLVHDYRVVMYNTSVTTKILCALIVAIFLMAGCAGIDRLSVKEEETPANLMSKGLKSFEKRHYLGANEAFQKIKDRYPYSKFAVAAELKMADTHYELKHYHEAFGAYNEFERLHPKNSNIPYVIYQKAMCDFKQVSSIDRDQSHTYQAKEEFEQLVKRFPESEYAHKAFKRIRECYINLAEYELYVARFYFKQKKYRAAMDRYYYLLKTYPDLGQYYEALEYLKRCKEILALEQNHESAQESG